MKALIAIIILNLFSFQLEAKSSGVSLEEAVNQVKSEGRVLSAKTINGKHEIKVLTPSGTVKTINKPAARAPIKIKRPRPEYYNKGGQSMRDRKQNPAIPSRFNNRQKNNRQKNNRMDSRQLDLQSMAGQKRNQSNKKNKTTKNNKKDK